MRNSSRTISCSAKKSYDKTSSSSEFPHLPATLLPFLCFQKRSSRKIQTLVQAGFIRLSLPLREYGFYFKKNKLKKSPFQRKSALCRLQTHTQAAKHPQPEAAIAETHRGVLRGETGAEPAQTRPPPPPATRAGRSVRACRGDPSPPRPPHPPARPEAGSPPHRAALTPSSQPRSSPTALRERRAPAAPLPRPSSPSPPPRPGAAAAACAPAGTYRPLSGGDEAAQSER